MARSPLDPSQTDPVKPWVDRPVARICATAVLLIVLFVLGWMHRDDLFPPEVPVASDDPVARCFAARSAEIDRMVSEGIFSAEQAALFKTRAEALCQAQPDSVPAVPE